MINLNESPIKTSTYHRVTIRAQVRVEATTTVEFDEDTVREYFDLTTDDSITQALIEEYATECEDLDPFWDVSNSIDEFDRTEIADHTSERRTVVPPEFVPLPGMEGDLGG
jgi:hypothetical protein